MNPKSQLYNAKKPYLLNVYTLKVTCQIPKSHRYNPMQWAFARSHTEKPRIYSFLDFSVRSLA